MCGGINDHNRNDAADRNEAANHVELSVIDLDLRQWALLDMLVDGAGIRYVLDGPTLWVGADRLDDVLSIIDAVRADELAA